MTKTATTKRQTPTANEPSQQAAAKAKADRFSARVATDGTCNAVVVQQYLPGVNGGGDAQALADIGGEQARAVGAGDLSQLERMLLSQATALQAMFVDLACRGKQQTSRDALQVYTTLALKCATGSRQAITALAELRTPKTVMFAKQANLTTGPQQVVNNGVAATLPESGMGKARRLDDPKAQAAIKAPRRTHAGEFQPGRNELLEERHGERLDA